ncbi:MAG: TspO/MBR family protein [Clostridium sp.]
MDKKNIKIKAIPLIINVTVPLFIGFLINKLLPKTEEIYEQLQKPAFAPPGFVFPIVWTILYILMGIAAYKIYILKYEKVDSSSAMFIYYIQLLLNFLWSIIFFGLRLYGVAFIELVILIIFILITIKRFYAKGGKIPALLMMPYLIWSIYAAVLNFFVWMLNEM